MTFIKNFSREVQLTFSSVYVDLKKPTITEVNQPKRSTGTNGGCGLTVFLSLPQPTHLSQFKTCMRKQ